MILTISGNKYTFGNNQVGIELLMDKIDNELINGNQFISHLVVDGTEVYDDYEEYMFEYMSEIKDVEVITMTIGEFVGNLLVSLNTYTKRAEPEISRLVTEFYQNPNEQSWVTLHQLLEGIGWIYETIKSIDNVHHEIADWNEFITIAASFEVELPNLLEAIQNKDAILIADIIQYEILPHFQVISKETEEHFQQQNIAK